MYRISIHSEFSDNNGKIFKTSGSFFTSSKPDYFSANFDVRVLTDFCPMILGLENSHAMIRVFNEENKRVYKHDYVNTMGIMRSYEIHSRLIDEPKPGNFYPDDRFLEDLEVTKNVLIEFLNN